MTAGLANDIMFLRESSPFFFFSNYLGFGSWVFHVELNVHHATVPVCVSFVCFILILHQFFVSFHFHVMINTASKLCG